MGSNVFQILVSRAELPSERGVIRDAKKACVSILPTKESTEVEAMLEMENENKKIGERLTRISWLPE